MTYTKKYILSAFEATGISPLNECRVLPPGEKLHCTVTTTTTVSKKHEFFVPKTPKHGHSILIHGRKTLAALPKSTPKSHYNHALVEKLFKKAAQAKADNVILTIEIQNLHNKATSAIDKEKTKSRKEMSKARVISVQDVLRIREEQQKKNEINPQKKAKTAERRAAKTAKLSIPTATPKRKRIPKKTITLEHSSDILALENLNIGSEPESEWVEGGDDTPYQSGNSSVITHTGQRITRSRYRNASLHA